MKGKVLTISAFLAGLFAVAAAALIYFFLVVRYYELHTIVEENTVERYAINIAQLLLSHPNLTYEKSGSIQRGIFEIRNVLTPANSR